LAAERLIIRCISFTSLVFAFLSISALVYFVRSLISFVLLFSLFCLIRPAA